ncbi:hypothetical protein ALP45_03278 [Pseudomonas coronafaciens pv. atropurpurea]|nr:hypothetical protein ALP45_03278 [Pseudomonas coronafaciens pv. atropurpurea]
MTDLYIQNQQSKVCEIHKMEYCTLCANDLKLWAGRARDVSQYNALLNR